MNEKKQRKILVVDDQEDLVEIIRDELCEHQYQVLAAGNGEEALAQIEKEGLPDLILLDMKMPVMDGWTFARIFFDRYGRSCPLVIMTAADDSRTRAMEIGADTYLEKPFEMEVLCKLVESLMTD